MPNSDFIPSYSSARHNPNMAVPTAPALIKFVHLPGGFGRLWRIFLAAVALSVLTLSVAKDLIWLLKQAPGRTHA